MTSSPLARLDLKSATVSLPGAMLSLSMLSEVCSALKRVETCTEVDLSGNQIGDDGAEIVADLIASKPRIVHLNLRHNGIADVGMSLLCRGLAREGTCRSLNLSGNPISDIGLAELSKFVMRSNDLETLNLMDTPISLRGTLAFSDSLVRNESLLTVKLPHVLGHRVLNEVGRLTLRNRKRRDALDEKRAERAVEQQQEREYEMKINHRWKAVQPKAKPLPPATGFTLQEWADKDLAPILMQLEVLSKKQQMKRRREALRNDDDEHDVLKQSPLSGIASRVGAVPKARNAMGSSGRRAVTKLNSSSGSGWGSARQALAASSTAAQQVPTLPPIQCGRKCW